MARAANLAQPPAAGSAARRARTRIGPALSHAASDSAIAVEETAAT